MAGVEGPGEMFYDGLAVTETRRASLRVVDFELLRSWTLANSRTG